jgi:hypothetical protein
VSLLSRGAASVACCLALAASALGCGGLAVGGEGPLIGTGEVTALDELLETLIADVSAQPQEDRRFSRYLLLTPRDRDGFWPGELSGTDAQDGGVATERRTVGKRINSLSLQPGLVLPVPVSLGRILRLDRGTTAGSSRSTMPTRPRTTGTRSRGGRAGGRDPAQPDQLLRNAASCFACHNGGLIPFRDEVRSRVASGATPDGASDPERTRVLSTYPDPPVMDRLVNEWNTAYESAAEQAGQAPGSPDPITLSDLRFLSGYVTADVAARELFVSPVELEAALLTLDLSLAAFGDAAGVVERSAYRTVYRQSFCRLYEDKKNRPAACP